MKPGTNADTLSDMKTFTVRDLDRQPGAVLDACEKEGAVLIRRRDGRAYKVSPHIATGKRIALPDFRARMKATGIKPASFKQAKQLDKMIAGE